MTRLTPLLCAVTAVLAGGCAMATGAAVAGVAPRAQLAGFACHSALNPIGRTVAVTSVMRPVPGTRTLSVRFSLLERIPGAALRSVPDSGDLGRWLTPADPTLGRRSADVWKLAKTVYDVDAPARYRFAVDFRWLGAHDEILSTTTLRSPACGVRDLRPDLRVARVAVTPVAGRPDRDHYVAVIANSGATATGPFSVLFSSGSGAGGGVMQTHAVPSLGPDASARVRFLGPVCDAADPPTVVADPDDRVEDADRSDNTLVVACPGT